MNDYQTMINDLNGASLSNNQILIGPSTCCNWNETDLFNMGELKARYMHAWGWRTDESGCKGYLTTYASNLKMVAVQKYPTGKCIYAHLLDGRLTVVCSDNCKING